MNFITLFHDMKLTYFCGLFVMSWAIKIPKQWSISSDFEKYIDSPYFVDKTKFIETLLDLRHAAYVGAPPGFGKSSILSMLEKFFERIVRSNETMLTETKNFALFSKEPRYLNRRLKIFDEDRQLFAEHFGRYPVVSLDFGCICVENELTMIRSLAEMTRTAIRRHSYLIDSPKVLPVERELMASFLEAGNEGVDDSPDIREMALSLVRALKRHFDENIVLLIDNLDSPAKKLFMGDHSEYIPVEEMISILGKFTGTLSKSPDLKLCFTTGVTHFAGLLSRSTLHASNIVHHSIFTSQEIAPFFGLTDNEVDKISERLDSPNESGHLREWYGGHLVTDSELEMFSASSVIEWFDNKIYQPYWPEKSNHDIERFFTFERLGRDMWEAIQGHALEIIFLPRVENADIRALRAMLENPGLTNAKSQSMLVQFVAENGLLTTSSFTEAGHIKHGLSCPNTETRMASAEILWLSITKKYRMASIDLQECGRSLRELASKRRNCQTFVQHVGHLWKYFKPPYGNAEFTVTLLVSALHDGERENAVGAGNSWLEAKNGNWSSASHFMGTIDCVLLREHVKKDKTITTGYIIEVSFEKRGSSRGALKRIIDGDYVGVFEDSHPQLASKNLSYVLIGLQAEEDKRISASVLLDGYDSDLVVNAQNFDCN